jgi:hypothetical protein
MNLYKHNTCSLIIKVWLEENGEQAHRHWRGHITHVFSGKRQYFEDLPAITDFIELYLTKMFTAVDASETVCKGVRRCGCVPHDHAMGAPRDLG